MTYYIYTLGCKVNQYDSQQLAAALSDMGMTPAENKEKADVYVINSCTVTAESSRKSRQALRRFRTLNPNAVTVLTGCYSQAFAEDAFALESADIVLGHCTNSELADSVNLFLSTGKPVRNVIPHSINDRYCGGTISAFEGHTRAFVKIQDGCNRRCSYCVIPRARGFSRSKPLEDIKNEIHTLAGRGFKEIVFVGINLSAYGRDLENTDLCDALMLAEEADGIERIRLGSLEPDHITDDIIKKLAGMKKFCPQFHLSLQSGCDSVLKRMNRHYTTAEYSELCRKLKDSFDDISLTTDIIPGFPGETDEDFAETVDFAIKTGFMKVHVFPFSPREGTPAYSYPDTVPADIKEKRCAYLQQKADEVRADFLEKYNGKTVKVLFESPKNGLQKGYTENYTPVAVKSDKLLTGLILPVKITEVTDEICFGELQ